MPVGIWADGALGLGAFGLLSGFCHTKKKTVPIGCCSWERFGLGCGLLSVQMLYMCIHTDTRQKKKNQTAESHKLLHDYVTGCRKSTSSPGAKEEDPSPPIILLSHATLQTA